MKTFVFFIFKYRKWIDICLSVLCFVLFLFPRFAQKYPYFIGLPLFYLDWGESIGNFNIFSWGVKELRLLFSFYIIYILFIAASLTCAIFCIIRQFKNKKQYFFCSFIFATLAMFFQAFNFNTDDISGKVMTEFDLCFNFYIFLVLLILDIVFLILEWYYIRTDHPDKLAQRLAERKATKQARQEAEYKQSNEYRIEQLEKELQELKSKNNNDNDNKS